MSVGFCDNQWMLLFCINQLLNYKKQFYTVLALNSNQSLHFIPKVFSHSLKNEILINSVFIPNIKWVNSLNWLLSMKQSLSFVLNVKSHWWRLIVFGPWLGYKVGGCESFCSIFKRGLWSPGNVACRSVTCVRCRSWTTHVCVCETHEKIKGHVQALSSRHSWLIRPQRTDRLLCSTGRSFILSYF